MSRQRFSVTDVVPHRDTMSLLDTIDDYGGDWLSASVTITPDSLFADSNGVPAWVGIEYMAQAIAAYGGVQRRLAGLDVLVGFLVGTRRYHCSVPRFPVGSRLVITVTKEYHADNGLGSFQCSIRGDNGVCSESAIHAEAMLKVYLPENLDLFLQQEGTVL